MPELKAPVILAGLDQSFHAGLEAAAVAGLIRKVVLFPNAAAEFAAQFPCPVKEFALFGEAAPAVRNGADGSHGLGPGRVDETDHVAQQFIMIGAAGGRNHGPVFAFQGQAVNQAAAAVKQGLQLGGDTEDITGAGQDKAVTGQQAGLDLLIVVRQMATAAPVAGIAAETGLYLQC